MASWKSPQCNFRMRLIALNSARLECKTDGFWQTLLSGDHHCFSSRVTFSSFPTASLFISRIRTSFSSSFPRHLVAPQPMHCDFMLANYCRAQSSSRALRSLAPGHVFLPTLDLLLGVQGQSAFRPQALVDLPPAYTCRSRRQARQSTILTQQPEAQSRQPP